MLSRLRAQPLDLLLQHQLRRRLSPAFSLAQTSLQGGQVSVNGAVESVPDDGHEAFNTVSKIWIYKLIKIILSSVCSTGEHSQLVLCCGPFSYEQRVLLAAVLVFFVRATRAARKIYG